MKHLAIAFVLLIPWPAAAVKAPSVRTYFVSQAFIGNEAAADPCFVSKGGVDVRVFNGECPDEKSYNAIEADLLRAVGGRRSYFKGLHVIYTSHDVFAFERSTGHFSSVNGVTHYGRHPVTQKVVQLVVVSVNDTSDCTPTRTLRHELGHVIFMKAGLGNGDFLDHAPDSTLCDSSDNSTLEQIIMVPGRTLPDGPIRQKIKAVK